VQNESKVANASWLFSKAKMVWILHMYCCGTTRLVYVHVEGKSQLSFTAQGLCKVL